MTGTDAPPSEVLVKIEPRRLWPCKHFVYTPGGNALAELPDSVLPQSVGVKAIVLSTFVFMLAHTLWLAAIIAGLAYAWLYVRTGKLWVPIIAHAVTNGMLGVWVVTTGKWAFW